ncbi:hypothetical protein MYX78_07200 [Acidobacteria bacterium AH-259-G07]|nr:hypothetical protein [Acidobacteria bacterium AH-259-G07]
MLVRPTNLIYTAVAGTFSPSSQNVRLAKLTPGSVEARSGITYLDDDGWLELLPPNLVLSDEDPRKMVVQPNLIQRNGDPRPPASTVPGWRCSSVTEAHRSRWTSFSW